MIKIFYKSLCVVLAILMGCMVNGAMAASELGSPVGTKATLSSDYTQLVENAFPKFDAPALKTRFQGVALKYAQPIDTIRIRDLSGLEQVMKINIQQHTPGLKIFKQEGLGYAVNPDIGKIRFLSAIQTPLALTKAVGLQRLPEFTQRHAALISQLGVTQDQIFSNKTSLLMTEGGTNPKDGAVRKMEPVVTGVTTYVIRAIDGIIVEGSYAKVASFSPDKINAVHLNWPRLQLHPTVKNFEPKSLQSLKQAIADRVKAIAGREKANVKMAVVLLPVTEGGMTYMKPVMKVAVRTKSGSAGVIFYEGLSDQAIQIEKQASDSESGGAQSR
jgi:hypothetical protein